MRFANRGGTRAPTPCDSPAPEQRDRDVGDQLPETRFEVIDLPSLRKNDKTLSNEQAAVGLALQRYYSIHAADPTPTQLQDLLNLLSNRTDPD